MKKLIFFLFLSSFAFGQLSQDSLQSIVKNYFEKDYVQRTFKDPYSYELLSLTSSSSPRTRKDILNSEIATAKEMMMPPTPKKYRKKYEMEMNKNIELLNSLSEEEKNRIIEYDFYLDAYGANSYGNKVLGRYWIIVFSDGNIKKITKFN